MPVQLSPRKGLLVLARHGESEGNQLNIFTGWRDLPLTVEGRREAVALAERLAAAWISLDVVFTSSLRRAQETAAIILETLHQDTTIQATKALNERDYGELTGMNKAEAAKRWGAEQVRLWRRSFELRPPGGESLRDTAQRVLPFYDREIRPVLMRGSRVLVVAHGNSLRALIMRMQSLTAKEIETVELRTGEIRLYEVDRDGAAKMQADL